MAGKLKRRKKNLSRGTWIGIGVGVAALVVVPMLVVLGTGLYGVKKVTEDF